MLRPDLIFDMQTSGKGGTGAQVYKRMTEEKVDAQRGRVIGVHPLRSNPGTAAPGSKPIQEVRDLERVVGRRLRRGVKGGAKTFGEMEALYYR